MNQMPIVVAARGFREKVQAQIGSLLYCEWSQSEAGHSGIYLGDDNIIHLGADKKIAVVGVEDFIKTDHAQATLEDTPIYVSCKGKQAIGSLFAVAVAQDKLYAHPDLRLQSSHQFTSACYTGNFDNQDHVFAMVKDATKFRLGWDNWRVWQI